ncbi:hypothetical protein DFJ73DRAFT_800030 [Zopfochytrium polystomum]|nr:hypothetical protein DFJ73DRAFT_800030 [Zopfochytrium polystomum]
MTTAQAAALAKLYSVTGGPTWHNKDGWASLTDDASACAAHGVVCSGSTVIGLHLDSNNLQGPLPDVFGSLSAISALSFYNNTLVGAVPESLMDLPSLDHVDLRTNHLDGPVPNFAIDYTRGGNCLLNDNDFTCHLDMTTGCVVDTVPECNGNVPTGTVYNTNPGLSKGAVAGIAVSCVLVFATLLGAAAFLYQRRRRAAAGRSRLGTDERDLPGYSSPASYADEDVKAPIDGGDVKVDPTTTRARRASHGDVLLSDAAASPASVGFLGRVFGGSKPVASSEEEADAEHDAPAAARPARPSSTGSATDAKGLYSHQTAFAAASAKRAAAARARAAAKKGSVSGPSGGESSA